MRLYLKRDSSKQAGDDSGSGLDVHFACAGAKVGDERPPAQQHPEDSGVVAGASASAAAATPDGAAAAADAAHAATADKGHADEAAAAHAAAEEEPLAWLPATTAAIALRLAAFDAALIYAPGVPPARDTLQVCADIIAAVHAMLS